MQVKSGSIWVLVIALVSSLTAEAQMPKRKQKPVSFQRHYNEILPKAPQYKSAHWFFGPGATYALTQFVPKNQTVSESASERLDGKFNALGKLGLYAEFGRYRMLSYSRLFKYIDYGVSYKSIRGREKSEGTLLSIPSETVLGTSAAAGTFGYHYVELFFNANHVWRLSRYNFIQHSVGVNAGYAFLRNLSGATIAGAPMSPGSFSTQIHYKLGFGIKMRGNWLLIPSVETPVLNLLPFEVPRSSYAFFNSRYRPIIFSLRVFLMKPSSGVECTPVRTREGVKMPTDMDKQRQMQEGGGGT